MLVLDSLIKAIQKSKTEKVKDRDVISNETRRYVTFEGFSSFRRKFEDYIIQTIEGLSIDPPIDKKTVEMSPVEYEEFQEWKKKQAEKEKRQTATKSRKSAQKAETAKEPETADIENMPAEQDK